MSPLIEGSILLSGLLALQACGRESVCDDDNHCADLSNTVLYPGPCSTIGVQYRDGELARDQCSYEYDGDQLLARMDARFLNEYGETAAINIDYLRDSTGDLTSIRYQNEWTLSCDIAEWSLGEAEVTENFHQGTETEWMEGGIISCRPPGRSLSSATYTAQGFRYLADPFACGQRPRSIETLLTTTDAEGRIASYSYSGSVATGERTQTRLDEESGETTTRLFLYDPSGRLLGWSDDRGHNSLTYDNDGHLTSWVEEVENAPELDADNIKYYYDTAGNLAATITKRSNEDGVYRRTVHIYDYSCW